ncbi:1385_t:CDS:1, partial [Entrophospora sp. SA101]
MNGHAFPVNKKMRHNSTLWLCSNSQKIIKEIIKKCKRYITEKIKSLKQYNNKDHMGAVLGKHG